MQCSFSLVGEKKNEGKEENSLTSVFFIFKLSQDITTVMEKAFDSIMGKDNKC